MFLIVPVGSGIALAMKYEGKPNVCLTSYGDGSANQGQILWDLPVIFVCENNGYGFWTRPNKSSASTEYHTRGDYIPGIKVDGMDGLAVREATAFAREFVLKNGPIIIEAKTYRYHGHNTRETGNEYRGSEERMDAQRRDPISRHRNRLVNSGLATTQELQDIDGDISKEVAKAADKALSDPEPPLDELLTPLLHTSAQ